MHHHMTSQLLPPRALRLPGDPSLLLVVDLEAGGPGVAPAGHPQPLPPQPPPVLGEVGVVDVQHQHHPPLLTAVDHLDKMTEWRQMQKFLKNINISFLLRGCFLII